MAVTARRIFANVKSSAIRPRQPEVPNLMGESVIRRYSSLSYGKEKNDSREWVCARERPNEIRWKISSGADDLRLLDGRPANRTQRSQQRTRGVREHYT